MALTSTLKDAAYTTIGLGVLGFQKAQVRRVELRQQVADFSKTLPEITRTLPEFAKTLPEFGKATLPVLAQEFDARFAPVRQQLDHGLDAIEGQLPEQAHEMVKQARASARDTETQVRAAFGLSPSA